MEVRALASEERAARSRRTPDTVGPPRLLERSLLFGWNPCRGVQRSGLCARNVQQRAAQEVRREPAALDPVETLVSAVPSPAIVRTDNEHVVVTYLKSACPDDVLLAPVSDANVDPLVARKRDDASDPVGDGVHRRPAVSVRRQLDKPVEERGRFAAPTRLAYPEQRWGADIPPRPNLVELPPQAELPEVYTTHRSILELTDNRTAQPSIRSHDNPTPARSRLSRSIITDKVKQLNTSPERRAGASPTGTSGTLGRRERCRGPPGAEFRHNSLVENTPILRRLVRLLSLCVSTGLLVVACASGPPQPVDDSVLLPLPAGFTIVEDSNDGPIQCGRTSCGRVWVLQPDSDAPTEDHVAIIATHVGSNVGKTLEPGNLPESERWLLYESNDLSIRVEPLDNGQVRVGVSNG